MSGSPADGSPALGSIASVIPPIHREGFKFIAVFAIGALLLSWIAAPLGYLGLALTIWCALFFRDPVRTVPRIEGALIAPADGIVCDVSEQDCPDELGIGAGRRMRVCIFMNVFNVHVNRAPAAGRVCKLNYIPGKFFNASLDKASKDNERQVVVFETPDGEQVPTVQIAGLVARRILCEVKEGDSLETGERFGLIRFGSRVDVWLPEGYAPQVIVGQTAVAGETVIARKGAGALVGARI